MLRREQIVQAAFRVATREGLEQLTIRLVAAEAGLSTRLVFFHFTSKETLLLALLDWLLDSLFENWETPGDLPPQSAYSPCFSLICKIRIKVKGSKRQPG